MKGPCSEWVSRVAYCAREAQSCGAHQRTGRGWRWRWRWRRLVSPSRAVQGSVAYRPSRFRRRRKSRAITAVLRQVRQDGATRSASNAGQLTSHDSITSASCWFILTVPCSRLRVDDTHRECLSTGARGLEEGQLWDGHQYTHPPALHSSPCFCSNYI